MVELLVVIAIISLLAGILVPSLQSGMTLGRSAACMNNLHSLGVALRMYLNQSNDIMPTVASMPSLGISADPRFADVIEPYLDHLETMKCPGDRRQTFFETEGSSYSFRSSLGGKTITDVCIKRSLAEEDLFVMFDYDRSFHGGWMNWLYADGHVDNRKTN